MFAGSVREVSILFAGSVTSRKYNHHLWQIHHFHEKSDLTELDEIGCDRSRWSSILRNSRTVGCTSTKYRPRPASESRTVVKIHHFRDRWILSLGSGKCWFRLREVTLPANKIDTSRTLPAHFLQTKCTLPGIDLNQHLSWNVGLNQSREVYILFAGSVREVSGKCRFCLQEV